MARKRQHDELEGLYKSDLEYLIDEITVGALAYRNVDDPTVVPTPLINVIDGSLSVTRIA